MGIILLAVGTLIVAGGLFGIVKALEGWYRSQHKTSVEAIMAGTLIVMSLAGVACGLGLCWIGGGQ